ncbi:MAG TPA: SRPBCC domain-containing protein [Rhizomicrobium sp.]|jgi:activator of HSP90 ATPase
MLNRRHLASAGAMLACLGPAGASRAAEITAASASIHEETSFAAPPARVYAVLTTAALFEKLVDASAAKKSGALSTAPVAIDARPGGAFSLFGGYISGFDLELVPDTRLVQAWRTAIWAPGAYSIVSFKLAASPAGTALSLDQKGFPDDQASHLAAGWHINYFEPLAKVLAAS